MSAGASARRSEVWPVDLGYAAKVRPCLVLSIEAALAYACREAGTPARMLALCGAVNGRERPLAESDVRPVQPAEAKR